MLLALRMFVLKLITIEAMNELIISKRDILFAGQTSSIARVGLNCQKKRAIVNLKLIQRSKCISLLFIRYKNAIQSSCDSGSVEVQI